MTLKPKRFNLWTDYPTPLPYGSIEELYEEVRAYLKKFLYLSDERYFDVLASFVLASYRQEDFDVATYLFFYGPFKSGKSRALELSSLLCYRGYKNENASTASLYSIIEKYHPTPCLDETQKYRRSERSEILDLLNSGQRRPGFVTRMQKNSDGNFDDTTYEVFGLKVLAGLDEFIKSLNSRCIIIHMRKAPFRISKFRWSKAVEETKELRAKLLYYRLQTLRTVIDTGSDDPFTDDRNAEIFEPLLAIAPTKATRNVLIAIGKEIEHDQAQDEASSIEAEVLAAVLQVFDELCKKLGAVILDGCLIEIKEITDTFHQGRAQEQPFSNRSIGRVLSRLGFKKDRKPDKTRQRGITWDSQLAYELALRYMPEAIDRYSLHPKKMSDTSNTSNVATTDIKLEEATGHQDQTKDRPLDNTDISDISDIEGGDVVQPISDTGALD